MSETDYEELAFFSVVSFMLLCLTGAVYALAYAGAGVVGIIVLTLLIGVSVSSGWYITTQTEI